jgi:hypothetical protein
MTAPNSVPWPYRFALILTASALLLAIISMMFTGIVGTALAFGAGALAVFAALRFWQAWHQRV